ncbi:MAG: hypothetical protein M1822_006294 [Bathelium mastoideum]|nr:MAG: hypothetical protein M1822_006294 [Bathelium mastoideum]
MPDQSTIKEFPDISDKLKAAPKKSVFERQKAEAEAKRLREEKETAAVLEDFVKSFDDEDDTSPASKLGGRFGDHEAPVMGGLRGGAPPGNAPRRHFGPATSKMKSGPGTLPPDPAFSRKRGPDGYPKEQDRERGLFAFENSSAGVAIVNSAFQDAGDFGDKTENARAVDKAAPKPTVHLSSLPPGTAHTVIGALMPKNLGVEGVKILPPSAPGSQERKSMSAIITLSSDTPAMEIDAAVNQLQNRYLGKGYYLSITRHLSSATLGGSLGASSVMTPSAKLPFNAKPVSSGSYDSLSRAPPPGAGRGFAPPASYAPSGPGQLNRSPALQVNVTLPSDIRQLRLIHKTIENLVTHGPEFEALLMGCGQVQRDEKWAWIWDARSIGGVYYRWKLWEVLAGDVSTTNQNAFQQDLSQQIYDEGPVWRPPEKLRFEYATHFDDFASDSEYDSSEEDESEDEGIAKRYRDHLGGEADSSALDAEERQYLNPLEKAKLVQLLARLPTSTARLRRGDVVRISHFAISHSAVGVQEIINLLVSNLESPFAFTGAKLDLKLDSSDEDSDSEDEALKSAEREKEKEDPSSAKLVALYVITDLLNSCANAGVRGAWRYRSAFAPVFEKRQVFENLGRLDKELQWGRIRTEKWKRAIGAVFSNWEMNSVFDSDRLQYFKDVFEKPPVTREEKEEMERKEVEEQEKNKAKSKWRSVEEKAQNKEVPDEGNLDESQVGVDDSRGENLQYEPMELDTIDAAAIAEDNDGESMLEEELAELELAEEELMEFLTEEEFMELEAEKEAEKETYAEETDDQLEEKREDQQAAASNDVPTSEGETAAARAKRNRPKAVDMFADESD